MKNKLVDLNNHLFEQLERLNDPDTYGETLNHEISRANAMSGIAKQIVATCNLALQAQKFKDTAESADVQLPQMLDS